LSIADWKPVTGGVLIFIWQSKIGNWQRSPFPFHAFACFPSASYCREMNVGKAETFLPVTQEFLDSILNLKPRVAAFDCDGTLWSGDAGERFFDWELREEHVFPDVRKREELSAFWRERYAAYKRGEVDETTTCGEMVTMHQGISERKMMDAATRFFDQFFVAQIFPEMRELVRRLQEHGCEVWAVSSSNEWVIRSGMRHFGVPESRILAAQVEIDHGVATGRLVRVPSGAGKPRALREVVKKEIEAAFGNSRWDSEMLAMAKHAFAVNPNPDLETTARQQGWGIYFPEGTRPRG
jgi:HAD superfamily phosphoserine phosphatase-like hydrolase